MRIIRAHLSNQKDINFRNRRYIKTQLHSYTSINQYYYHEIMKYNGAAKCIQKIASVNLNANVKINFTYIKLS